MSASTTPSTPEDSLQRPIGLVIAMEEEAQYIRKRLQQAEEVKCGNLVFYKGCFPLSTGSDTELPRYEPVVIGICGIGKVGAALTTSVLCFHFNPREVYSIGAAGSMSSDLKLADVVLADKVQYHDVDLTRLQGFGEYKKGMLPGYGDTIFSVDLTPFRDILNAGELNGIKFKAGLCVTGEIFVGSQEDKQTILDAFPAAQTADMECAAVAQTCQKFGVPFFVARMVSDQADESACQSFSEVLDLVAKKLADVLEILLETRIRTMGSN